MNKRDLAWFILACLVATNILYFNVGLGFLLNSDSSLLVWFTLPSLVGVVFGNLAVFNRYVKGNIFDDEKSS